MAISDPIRTEVLRTLRDKFRWSEERLTEASSSIGTAATIEIIQVAEFLHRIGDPEHP